MADRQLTGTPVFSAEERFKASTALYTKERVIVLLRRPVDTAHGTRLETYGDPIEVACGVEGRQNQAGLFANSGAQDVPQDQGGLTEITPIQIIALEWPGNIYSAVWYLNDLYDTIGSPVFHQNGTARSRHWELRAERRRQNVPKPVVPEGARIWGM